MPQSCGKPVIEMAWFYRCKEKPGVEREDDCPMRFWKDTSGRYLDRETVRTLLKEGKAGPIDGFTARNGRTYTGNMEIDREKWQLKVRSLGYDEGVVSDQPEYEVNPEPLGRCPFEEECQVVESPTQFVCERQLKEVAEGEPRPEGCGFVLPRTVCKREITREEAEFYLRSGKTELLTDFTSRFGRPFSATLVLKKTGRHGFEFQPRAGGAGRKKTTRKATSAGKKSKKKVAAKKSGTRKKAATRKKSSTRKKASPRKKTAARKRNASSDATPGPAEES